MLPLDRPSPSPELQAHSALLQRVIEREIGASGPLAFERYMELALYAPGLGYYSAGSAKFGRSGDFVTAPELGSVFAECLARALAPLLRQLPYASILEIGAGSGALAADLWQALARLDAVPDRYWILERSADLRERQIERLELRAPQALPRVAWLDAPPREGFSGIVLANEVLDALPCARFQWSAGELQEIGVDVVDGRLAEVLLPPRPEVAAAVARIRAELPAEWPDGYRSELVPSLAPWLHTVSERLNQGVVLLADYGYPRSEFYLPERRAGTLLGHYRQRAFDDPLWMPGLVDLSASVDFTAVAEAAGAAGLEVGGFSSQAQFLLACGLAEVLAPNPRLFGEREQRRRADQARRLTLPDAMGERFKVLCLYRGLALEQLPEALRLPAELHRL